MGVREGALPPGAREFVTHSTAGDVYVVEMLPAAPRSYNLPPIIALHGEGRSVDGSVWYCILEPLAKLGYRVAAIDMPGYGKSTGSREEGKCGVQHVVRAVMNAMKVSSVVLVGRAEGGRGALHAAFALGPTVVKALVLSHPVPPSESVLKSPAMKRIPSLLTWAKDERWGLPFKGPHGAHYFVMCLGCDLLPWEHAECKDFYQSRYISAANEFLSALFAPRVKLRAPIKKGAQPPAPKTTTDEVEEEVEVSLTAEDIRKGLMEEEARLKEVAEAVGEGEEREEEEMLEREEEERGKQDMLEMKRQEEEERKKEEEARMKQEMLERKRQEEERARKEEEEEIPEELDTEEGVLLRQETSSMYEWSHPLEEIFVDGMHILRQGPSSGPTIFMMHGDGKRSCNEIWLPALGPLSEEGYNVLSVSFPGYGKSEGSRRIFRSDVTATSTIDQILSALRITGKVVIAGRSVGGKVALQYAATRPGKVAALLLTHPVSPGGSVLSAVKAPCLLTWAKDDAGGPGNPGNHPYFGPHGAAFMVQQLGCELFSWEEKTVRKKAGLVQKFKCALDAHLATEPIFYSENYPQRVAAFLRSKGVAPR